jgi:hypothetical protein
MERRHIASAKLAVVMKLQQSHIIAESLQHASFVKVTNLGSFGLANTCNRTNIVSLQKQTILQSTL